MFYNWLYVNNLKIYPSKIDEKLETTHPNWKERIKILVQFFMKTNNHLFARAIRSPTTVRVKLFRAPIRRKQNDSKIVIRVRLECALVPSRFKGRKKKYPVVAPVG